MPSAYLQWRFHSGERVVARGPLVFCCFFFFQRFTLTEYCFRVRSRKYKHGHILEVAEDDPVMLLIHFYKPYCCYPNYLKRLA